MHRTNGYLHRPQPTKLISEGTQSEEKTTRNVGTMHEPVKTRNFGNEVQPQSSATQTSFPLKKKTPKQVFTYIERPDHTPVVCDEQPYHEQRISPRFQFVPKEDIYYERATCRTPSPPQICVYPYDIQYSEYHTEVCPRPSPLLPSQQRKQPPVSYCPITTIITEERPIYRPRTPSPQRRSHTPTPPRRPRHPSPPRRPRSATPRHRPQMYSQETDTSLDAMKRRQHAGVQYEPRPTKEKGTSSSLRIKTQPTSHRLTTHDTTIYPQRYDRPQKTYYIQPTTIEYYPAEEEEEEEEEEETPSMHDQSTMAELLFSFDHYTQCESQPFMADRYVQTAPIYDEDEQRNLFDLPEDSHILELPRGGSISIHQPVIIQPDTLPRIRRTQHSPTRPKHDGLDYTGKNLELPLRHGQQQQATHTLNSPLLNIGTEHFIHQPPTNEYTTPFETRYVYGSDRSSTTNRPNIISALHSPRTHLFSNSPVHQSKSNGNFYLSTAPSHSLNSTFHLDITTNES
jgi:hypothetical protein